MKIYIKYMISRRCKTIVSEEFHKLGIKKFYVELGMVETVDDISPEQRERLRAELLLSGLEVMDDKNSIIIERIKNTIVEMVHHAHAFPKTNFSDYLAEYLEYDYTYLSNLFSKTTGTTIEQYIIAHKIEKVKELLLYDELNLTQISYDLHYSSVAHLSNQFKKVTGLTPTYFKKMKHARRQILDEL